MPMLAAIIHWGAALSLGALDPASACGAGISASPDSEVRDGPAGTAAVVPISVEGGEVIVDVSIDGRGPFPMMFDTGGHNVVTPETAAAVGLEVTGGAKGRGSGETDLSAAFARARQLRVGKAELLDQPLLVFPLPRFFTDRGNRPPLAGFVGYELLTAFAVRLDYEGRTLTLTPLHDFRPEGAGERMPFDFADTSPTVPAAVDRIPGKFVIDTGSTGALALHRRFVEVHGLAARHPAALRVKGAGADGLFETIVTRFDRFEIAGADIERPATQFPAGGRSGLPWTDVDGSVGYEILRQFVVTFDYGRRELWLERSPAFGAKTTLGRSGFQAVKLDSPEFRVVTVLPNTPADAAGIAVGDVITEIDGVSSAAIGQAEFGELMRRPDGTPVHLNVIRNGNPRPVALTLKELLP